MIASKTIDRKRFKSSFYAVIEKFPRLGIGFDLNAEGEVFPVTSQTNYNIFNNLSAKSVDEAKELGQKLVKYTHFNLKEGTLFRWFFIECEESEKQLVVCVFHHIICDGASIQELVQNIYNEYCLNNNELKSTNSGTSENYETSTKYWKRYLGDWYFKNNLLPPEFLKGNISNYVCRKDIREITKIAEYHSIRRSSLYIAAIGDAIRNIFGIKEPLLGVPAAINSTSTNNIGQRSSLIFVTSKYNSSIDEELQQHSNDLLLGMVNYAPISNIISGTNIKIESQIEANIPQIVVTIIPYSLRKLECLDWGVNSWEYLLGGNRYPILISIFEDEEFVDINVQSHYTLDESSEISKTILNYMISYIKIADGQSMRKILSPTDYTEIYESIKRSRKENILNRQNALEMYLNRSQNSVCVEEDGKEYTTKFLNSAIEYYLDKWELSDIKIVTVAIKEKRLWATVAAMIAAFISGRRFVILSDDINLSDRDIYIVENSKADVIVSDVCFDYDISYININTISDKYFLNKIELKAPAASSDAYLVYTSGTTGQPKGVRIGPSTVMQLVENTKMYLSKDVSRVYQFTEHTFDVFIQEVFFTIFTGGTLVAESKILNSELPKLPKLLEKKKIDAVFLPYAALSALAMSTEDAANNLSNIDVIFVTGEQLIVTPPIRKLFLDCNVRLINMYGPSETHVCSFFELPKDPSIWEKEPSIGKPAKGYEFLVMSPARLPVVAGIPGELVVLGKNVLNGYVGKDNHSVSNEYSSYWTGDMVVCNNNGYYKFLGRNDDQLKISGHRIHLGAIEAMLSEISNFPIVVSAVSQTNQTIIIGHYEGDLCEDEVKKLLELFRSKVPNYIVPKIMISCKVFPKGRTGKIDRKYLLDVAKEYLKNNQIQISLQSNINEQKFVKSIWESILNISIKDLDKSLFDLGGTSLDALQIYGAISKKYDIDFSELMKIPTIIGMSSLLKNQKGIVDINLEKYLSSFSIPRFIESKRENDFDLTLITGGTGFLGAHLVSSIISKGHKTRVLVRGDSKAHAKKRLKEKFDFYELDWFEELIDVVPGDLTNDNDIDNFLSKPAYRIIHAAAAVNFVKSFEEIANSNVKGTYNLLRKCSAINLPFVYVSTTAVFPSDNSIEEVTEDNKPGSPDNLLFGYPQSKWVADRLVEKFQTKGHKVYIVRAGRIGPSIKTGSMRTDDFFLLQIKSILELKRIPNSLFNSSKDIDLVPVDIIADIISNHEYLMNHPVLHIVLNDRITWKEIIELLGIKNIVKEINFKSWIQLLKENQSKELDLFRTLIPLIESGKLNQASYPVKTKFETELAEKFGLNHNNGITSLKKLKMKWF